jgi:DUF1016 N-terminal domain
MKRKALVTKRATGYDAMLDRVIGLIDEARRASARTVNALMTATYWLIGRHIVEFEQAGKSKAQYGEEIIDQLATDLTARFGRGFTRSNLFNMRAFYSANPRIVQTLSGQLQLPGKVQTASGKSSLAKEPRASAETTPKDFGADTLSKARNERVAGIRTRFSVVADQAADEED